MTLSRSILSLLVAVFLSACGESGTDPGNGNGGGDVREIVANPSFATHINEILERRGCTAAGCHGAGGGGATQTGLVLEAGSAANYAQLFNVASSQQPTILRVDPGDAASSYLIIKLQANPPSGLRMPRNGTPLDDIDMTNIMNWINNDAPNN